MPPDLYYTIINSSMLFCLMFKVKKKVIMKIKNRLLFITLFCLVFSSKAFSYSIFFSGQGEGDTWKKFLVANFKYEVSKHKELTKVIYQHAKDNPVNQLKQITKTLKEEKPDAMIVFASDKKILNNKLKEARKMGVKVVMVDAGVSDKDAYDVHISLDAVEMGRQQARWLVKKLGGKGNIVMFSGIRGQASAEARLQGAREVFSKEKGIRVLTHKYTSWQMSKATKEMTSILKAFKKVDGIWADSGLMSWPALKVLQEQKMPLVPSTGDQLNGYAKFVVNTGAEAIIYPNTTRVIRKGVQVALGLLKGKEKYPKHISYNPDNYYTSSKKDSKITIKDVVAMKRSDFWWVGDDKDGKKTIASKFLENIE